MRIVRREPRKARIEIVPMIDTVFFLLVFFMMSTLSMTVYRGLPVNLPQATSGQPARDENAAVTVARDGTTYLNKRIVAPERLAAELKSLVQSDPGVVVVISADEDVNHGRVVGVMDAARSAGVARLAIAVHPGTEERRP